MRLAHLCQFWYGYSLATAAFLGTLATSIGLKGLDI